MLTILLSVGVMIAFAVLMSLGLLLGGKELKGTCASKNVALSGTGTVCNVCGQTPGSCDNEKDEKNISVEMPKIQK
ncbi:MAG: hypothetical protein EAZ44_04815 [Cytophagia bacterium]|nr:MAG: hypothetical protein EAZ44_04815 [Cytophagia bacterium]TAH29760.1 MAG: hypothetical protein EAZ06_05385 [Cytophagales bacterium]